MKIEKDQFNVSLKEMILFSLILLLLYNGLAYFIFTLVLNKPFEELFQKTWIILIFLPVLHGIMHPLSNRNELLRIESHDKSEIIRRKVKELLNNLDYHEIHKDDNNTFFDFPTKWKRIINIPFNGKVKLVYDKDSILIYGKRITLSKIENKLRIDIELKDS